VHSRDANRRTPPNPKLYTITLTPTLTVTLTF